HAGAGLQLPPARARPRPSCAPALLPALAASRLRGAVPPWCCRALSRARRSARGALQLRRLWLPAPPPDAALRLPPARGPPHPGGVLRLPPAGGPSHPGGVLQLPPARVRLRPSGAPALLPAPAAIRLRAAALPALRSAASPPTASTGLLRRSAAVPPGQARSAAEQTHPR